MEMQINCWMIINMVFCLFLPENYMIENNMTTIRSNCNRPL